MLAWSRCPRGSVVLAPRPHTRTTSCTKGHGCSNPTGSLDWPARGRSSLSHPLTTPTLGLPELFSPAPLRIVRTRIDPNAYSHVVSTNHRMKDIRITVTDGEHERLSDIKGDRTWRETLFDALGAEKDE